MVRNRARLWRMRSVRRPSSVNRHQLDGNLGVSYLPFFVLKIVDGVFDDSKSQKVEKKCSTLRGGREKVSVATTRRKVVEGAKTCLPGRDCTSSHFHCL
jgi:hypothetical protein